MVVFGVTDKLVVPEVSAVVELASGNAELVHWNVCTWVKLYCTWRFTGDVDFSATTSDDWMKTDSAMVKITRKR